MEREAKEHEGTLPPPWAHTFPWRCRPSSQTGWSGRPPLTLCQGKTTSHPVSEYSQPLVCVFTGFLRETDLSLGSLLSRNQSLFGHSHHPPHPSLPLSSMSHLSQVKQNIYLSFLLIHLLQTLSQSVITAHAQSQTSQQPRRNVSGSTRSPGGGAGGPDRCYLNLNTWLY